MADFNFAPDKPPLSAYSLAGLADIILLLLIFFILTSSFVTQFGIQVTLPQAQASGVTDNGFVSVTITKEGTFYVQQELVGQDQLLDAVRSARENRTAVLLRADAEATVAQFAQVANVAQALDLRVLMATEREPSR
ncbi:MAG: biopolymer transporter ExbD [Bacteroidota bacterium]